MRVLLTAIAALLLTAAAATGAQGPAVRLVHAAPAVVSGTGYAPHAQINVAYRSGSTAARRTVVASARGSFTLTLPHVVFKRCDGVTLVAGAARLQVSPCSVAAGRPRIVFGYELGDRVQGSGFMPGESFVVSASVGAQHASAAGNADAGGHFSTRLALPRATCAEVFVRATGTLGSTATYSRPAPACISP